MPNFLVIYRCSRLVNSLTNGLITRPIVETDTINAIIAARQEERRGGVNCPDCRLMAVTLAS